MEFADYYDVIEWTLARFKTGSGGEEPTPALHQHQVRLLTRGLVLNLRLAGFQIVPIKGQHARKTSEPLSL